MAEVRTYRRYCLLTSRAWMSRGEPGREEVWRGKQIGEPGTALPSSFPFRAKLVAAGYQATEDLDGADEEELLSQGLNKKEAAAVLKALGS